jgi:hypothetical protein
LPDKKSAALQGVKQLYSTQIPPETTHHIHDIGAVDISKNILLKWRLTQECISVYFRAHRNPNARIFD